jgi:DNA-binding MarR family transcriptional regulator
VLDHPEGLLRFPTYVLGRLHKALHAEVDSSLRAHWVLSYLEDRGDISQQDISDGMAIDRSEVVRIMDTLERAGFVRRTRDTVDRRKYRLAITDAGRAERARVDGEVLAAHDRVLARLTPDERDTLHRLALKALGYDEQLRPLPQLSGNSPAGKT